MRPKFEIVNLHNRAENPDPTLILVQPANGEPKAEAKPVPKASTDSQDAIINVGQGFLGISALAARYGLSAKTIYEFIKQDPTFPYRNVGLKKKYVVDPKDFEAWLDARTKNEKQRHFGVPTHDELLAAFGTGRKGPIK